MRTVFLSFGYGVALFCGLNLCAQFNDAAVGLASGSPPAQPLLVQEAWLSLDAWTNTSTACVVSNGQLFSASTTQPCAVARPFPVDMAAGARMVARFTLPLTNGNAGHQGIVVIGLSKEPVGTLGQPGAQWVAGLGIAYNTSTKDNNFYVHAQNTTGLKPSMKLQGGTTYRLCVSVDENITSFVLIAPGHTNEYTLTLANRAWGSHSNLYVWNSDTRTLEGMAVNPLTAVPSHACLPAGAGRETDDFVISTVATWGTNSAKVRLWMPPCRGQSPAPAIVHGVKWTLQRWPAAELYALAESAGGADWANVYATHELDFVDSALIYPVLDMLWTFLKGGNPSNLIAAAYPGTTNWMSFLSLVNGHDPLGSGTKSIPISRLAGPAIIFNSPFDGAVPAAHNMIPFVTALSNLTSDVTMVLTKGGHGDPSNFQIPAVLAHFQRYSKIRTNQ